MNGKLRGSQLKRVTIIDKSRIGKTELSD